MEGQLGLQQKESKCEWDGCEGEAAAYLQAAANFGCSAQHSTAQHGTAQHSAAQRSAPCHEAHPLPPSPAACSGQNAVQRAIASAPK